MQSVTIILLSKGGCGLSPLFSFCSDELPWPLFELILTLGLRRNNYMDTRTRGKRMGPPGRSDSFGRSGYGFGNSQFGNFKDKNFAQIMSNRLGQMSNFTPQMIFSMWNNKNFGMTGYGQQGYNNAHPFASLHQHPQTGMLRTNLFSGNAQNAFFKDDDHEQNGGHKSAQMNGYQERPARESYMQEKNGSKGEQSGEGGAYQDAYYRQVSSEQSNQRQSMGQSQSYNQNSVGWQAIANSYQTQPSELRAPPAEKKPESNEASGSKNPSEATTGMPAIRPQPQATQGGQNTEAQEPVVQNKTDLFQSPYSQESNNPQEKTEKPSEANVKTQDYESYVQQQQSKVPTSAERPANWKTGTNDPYRRSDDDNYHQEAYQRSDSRYSREESASSQKYRYPYESSEYQQSGPRQAQYQYQRYPDQRNGQYYQSYNGRDNRAQAYAMSNGALRDQAQNFYQNGGARGGYQWNRQQDKYPTANSRQTGASFEGQTERSRPAQTGYDSESYQKSYATYQQEGQDTSQRQETEQSWPAKENFMSPERTQTSNYGAVSEQYARQLPAESQFQGQGAERYQQRQDQASYYQRAAPREQSDQRRQYQQGRESTGFSSQTGTVTPGQHQAAMERLYNGQNFYR